MKFLAYYLGICLCTGVLSYGLLLFFEWLRESNNRINRLDGGDYNG